MKAIVLLNSKAGTATDKSGTPLTDAVRNAFSDAGVDAVVRAVDVRELRSAAEAAAARADIVVAAGGDGTLNTVASVLIDKKTPFGVLPLGTCNHFAKDLRIPLNLDDAARVIAAGHMAEVDICQVNDHVFINHSALGMYPRIVLEREMHRSRYGLGKWTGMALAILNGLRRFPLIEVRVSGVDATGRVKTPLVFVGNNQYQLDQLNLEARSCPDEGELLLSVADTQSRWGAIRLGLRALVGGLEQDRDFKRTCLSECWIESRRRRLQVIVDGEVIDMQPPLHYRVLPRALTVCVPEEATSDSELPRVVSAAGA